MTTYDVQEVERRWTAGGIATNEAFTALLDAKGIVLTDEDKALLRRVYDAAYERITSYGREKR